MTLEWDLKMSAICSSELTRPSEDVGEDDNQSKYIWWILSNIIISNLNRALGGKKKKNGGRWEYT